MHPSDFGEHSRRIRCKLWPLVLKKLRRIMAQQSESAREHRRWDTATFIVYSRREKQLSYEWYYLPS